MEIALNRCTTWVGDGASRGHTCRNKPTRYLGIQSIHSDGTLGDIVPTPYCDEHWKDALLESAAPEQHYRVRYNRIITSETAPVEPAESGNAYD